MKPTTAEYLELALKFEMLFGHMGVQAPISSANPVSVRRGADKEDTLT
jgi:hypothetical protein